MGVPTGRGRAAAASFAVAVAAILGFESAVASTGVTFVVGSTGDVVDARPGDGSCATVSGACTLRAAIQEANALPGADVVRLPAGTYPLAILPRNENGIATGDLDITDGLTIAGADAAATIIDGGGLDRLFEVAVDGGAVALDELTLRDGHAAEYGGAIANNSTATVIVSDSALTGNRAGKAGGAIDNHLAGTVELSDSLVSANYATESGSALNNNRGGTLAVSGSTVAANSAAAVGLDPALVGAGAIANNAELDTAGTITVTDSEVIGNRAGGGSDGAAIYNDGSGSVTVAGTAFSGNVAIADGGAIYNGAGTLTVDDSTFDANGAGEGGAIYANAADGSATVRGSSFANNVATGRGGAVANSGTGRLTLLDSTFTANSAADWGGGVHNDNKGAVAMERIAFHGNTALSGGGFANEGSGLVTVGDSTFTSNTAVPSILMPGGEGGGMHSSSGGEVVIGDSAFSGNGALGGGGLSNAGGGTLDVTASRFAGNTADAQGGGILIESGAVRMSDIDVVENVAGGPEEAGGGISYAGDKSSIAGEAATIEASRIRDNEAAGPGGGIDSRGDGLLAVVTTSITGNTAAAGGAIHHVGDAPLEIVRSTLSGNVAEDGGGIVTDGDGAATVENSTVSGNRAARFGGGLLVSSNLVLRSSTVAGNSAASGGGIDSGGDDQVGDGSVSLRNSIVAASPTGGNCAGMMTSLGGNVEDGDSCLLRAPGDQPGTNPLLGPLADNGGPTRTHALLAGSPAQDGAVCSEPDPCPAIDQRGFARPLFGGYDAGAYESSTAPGGGGGQPCASVSERTVRADFDGWVSEAAPASNFGADATLKVASKPAANERALVRFTLPVVPPGCKLVGATLRLHSASATGGQTLQALRLAGPWSEGGVTWANQPAAVAPAASAPSGAGTVEWDVLAQARDMYASGSHGFLIRDADENGSGEQSFHSREKGDDNPPELVLRFADPDDPPPPGDCPTNPQSVAADMDSWVSQASPANNFGGDSTLKVKSQLANNSRALVRFPLPALPPGCSGVASAALRMNASSDTEGRTLHALRAASAWAESSVTWSNQPATTGPAATTTSGPELLSWNVTPQLRAMYASANHGLLIRDAVEDDGGHEQTLNSRDKLNDGPPELVIAFEDAAPETTIDAGPNGLTADATPTFGFSSEAGTSFECRVGGGAFTACTSPHTTTALPDGTHTFEVRAVDAEGTTDPTPAARTFTVDTTAPQTVLDDGPSGLINDRTPAYRFSSEGAAGFQCRVGSGAFTACTSPHTTAALADGTHTFHVRAFDAVGNVDSSPATRTVTVDTVAPETTIDKGPEPLTGDSTPAFEFSSEPGARFECRVGAAAFSACVSPYTAGPLAAGPHTFEVRAIDAAGNIGAPAEHAWAIDSTVPDTTAPQTELDDGPSGLTNDPTATFRFSSEVGAGFQCRVGSGTFTACTSPHTTAALADGTHTFEVRAVDAAANSDATPASHTWTIDTVAPQTAIDGPSGLTGDAMPTFAFSSEPGVTFQCRLGTGEWHGCESPWTMGPLADGTHEFQVRAVDPAGNTGSAASRTITVDTSAPDTAITSGPADVATVASPAGVPPVTAKPPPILARLRYTAKVRKGGTTLRSLRLTGVPAGALVRVRCDGRSCPRKSLRIASPSGGVVKLKPFHEERLRRGTTLTIRVSKPGMTDAVLVLKVRARRPPRLS